MLKTLVFFVSIVILLGCDSRVVKIPEYAIEADSLVPILVDIHMADAYLALKRVPDRDLLKSEFYAGVLKKHGVDKQKFDTTIRFFIANPDLYAVIYENVIAEFSRLEGDLAKEEAGEPKDSISFVSTQNEFDTVYPIQGESTFLKKVEEARRRKALLKNSDTLKRKTRLK